MIHIIDYGMGNLRSVSKGFERVGAEAKICTQPDELKHANHLVLPGVGAFRDAMQHLSESGFIDAIREHIAADKPFLGICLGLQLLFDVSYEDGEHAGLGIFPGEVVRFDQIGELKIPHMGWNQLIDRREENPLLNGIPDDAWFYFVHSYHAVPADPALVAARTDYGKPVVAMAGRGHVYATQFHPEKSQAHGLQILKNFAALN